MTIRYADTKRQSLAVFGQFGESKWKPYAKENAALPRKSAFELQNIGLGKFLVCAALGESLEQSIPIIKKYRNKIDVLTCDKGFKVLLENGITPDYVMICDCNIPTRWIDDAWNETKGVKLIATAYANVEWTKPWKGERYFYVNKDSIESERHFMPIMGPDTRIIPASTNVSNAMVVFMSGLDETTRINFSGYEKLFLTGYDYSWRPEGNYYAFNNPVPKRNYMQHRTLLDLNRDIVFTSENLLFSAKWLFNYIKQLNVPAVNCSERGLLQTQYAGSLESWLKKINTKPRKEVIAAFKEVQKHSARFEKAKASFNARRKELWQ